MRNFNLPRKIFRALTQNKWLSIEYQNKEGKITGYWIGIKDIDVKRNTLNVDGLHITQQTIANLNIYISSIVKAEVIDESYFCVPEALKEKIRENPDEFQCIFGSVVNLRILDYLQECVNLNTTPYKSEYSLLEHFDADSLKNTAQGLIYHLTDEQFSNLTRTFQLKTKSSSSYKFTRYLCLNILSVHTERGLHLIAYRKLLFDVKRRASFSDAHITMCKQFKIGNNPADRIEKFLDEDDYFLLRDFEGNIEKIKDAISKNIKSPREKVDDLPYIIPLTRDVPADLSDEFAFIKEQMESGSASEVLRAFFGNLTKPPVRRKKFPLALMNKNVNLDQLLAINNAMKYPLTYIQGPPGTGKTSTILNTILTAFFNERTVLFSSFNNHPIDSVCDSMTLSYRGKKIPFPIFRVGNREKIIETLNSWRDVIPELKNIAIYSATLERNKESEVAHSNKLTELLKVYEEKVELEERKSAIEQLLEINQNMTYQFNLQGIQLVNVKKRIEEIGEIKNEDALGLVYDNRDEMLQYFYYTSVKYIKRIYEPKNKDLLDIIQMVDEQNNERVKKFNDFLKSKENVLRFIRIFPIVASTCISSVKIGVPDVYFDMTIIDEASQCDIAFSLPPILRGKQLMLVGDPQQLNPVIVLDAKDNDTLKHIYKISPEYDFVKNSIYKTFLAADSVSKEILLSHHYRCAPEIIEFNNKKYYANQLKIETVSPKSLPLVFIDITDNNAHEKNTAPLEVKEIVEYASANPHQKIGVITPFVNQKKLIEEFIKSRHLENVTCGTVHTFQGDEKDVVLFSLALTDKTPLRTYQWINSNKELINVATSRAKEKLIVVGSEKQIDRLHEEAIKNPGGANCKTTKNNLQKQCDDVFELKNYVKLNGNCVITPQTTTSRALGIKPYSTQTEEEFLVTLSHALDNVISDYKKCTVKKEVGISAVFEGEKVEPNLFYSGRFDFVIYERGYDKKEIPVLAIELDGKEHREQSEVIKRDKQKNEICARHRLQLIRVDNTYARRYNYIKEVLEEFFIDK